MIEAILFWKYFTQLEQIFSLWFGCLLSSIAQWEQCWGNIISADHAWLGGWGVDGLNWTLHLLRGWGWACRVIFWAITNIFWLQIWLLDWLVVRLIFSYQNSGVWMRSRACDTFLNEIASDQSKLKVKCWLVAFWPIEFECCIDFLRSPSESDLKLAYSHYSE